MNARAISLAVLAIAACLACSEPAKPVDELGWPRAAINLSGGHERAHWDLTVDAQGKYKYSAQGDDGGGQIHFTRCAGSMPMSRAAPVFDLFEAIELIPRPSGYEMPRNNPRPSGGIVNERLEVSFLAGPQDSKVPAHRAGYERARDLGGAFLDAYRDDRPAGETCERGTIDR